MSRIAIRTYGQAGPAPLNEIMAGLNFPAISHEEMIVWQHWLDQVDDCDFEDLELFLLEWCQMPRSTTQIMMEKLTRTRGMFEYCMIRRSMNENEGLIIGMAYNSCGSFDRYKLCRWSESSSLIPDKAVEAVIAASKNLKKFYAGLKNILEVAWVFSVIIGIISVIAGFGLGYSGHLALGGYVINPTIIRLLLLVLVGCIASATTARILLVFWVQERCDVEFHIERFRDAKQAQLSFEKEATEQI